MIEVKSEKWRVTYDYFFSFVAILSALIMSCMFAFRDLSVGADTERYVQNFNYIAAGGDSNTDILFFYFIKLLSFFSVSPVFYFFCISIASSLAIVVSARFIYKGVLLDPRERFLAFVVFTVFIVFSPWFYAGNINILRHLLGSACLFSVLAFLVNGRACMALGCYLVGLGFHSSLILFSPFLLFLIAGSKFSVVAIVSLAGLYSLGLSKVLFGFVLSNLGLGGLLAEVDSYGSASDYRSGFRIDFLIFSMVLYSISVWGVFKAKLESERRLVAFLSSLLLPFLVFGYMAYSDRLLYSFWLVGSVFLPFFICSLVGKVRWFNNNTLLFYGLFFVLLGICFISYKLGYFGFLLIR